MKRTIAAMTALFLLAITVLYGGLAYSWQKSLAAATQDERTGYTAVLRNEITVLTDTLRDNPADLQALESLQSALSEWEALSHETPETDFGRLLLISYGICVLFALSVFGFCTLKIIRPFGQLEQFAGEVAKGNLDFPLEIHRQNIFGAFSWAFDAMRSELQTARENAENAKRENKALIAAISHDIKTPVASIRAYAEGLLNGMDNTPERRARYLSVIVKKSDEVTKLTNDLFLHALSDMEKLQLEIKPHNAKVLIEDILDPFCAELGRRLTLTGSIPDVMVRADQKRLAQVFENLIANAAKYAPDSNIELRFEESGDMLRCHVRDFGGGIPPADLPLIWNRFYRGENSEGIFGSGLGLYIVRYIIERCGGVVGLDNSEKGLTVTFSLPVENNRIA